MKTFSQIKTQINETLQREIRAIVEHLDGQSFSGVGGPNDFGRGGYDDPHHLSGRGQLLDVLIRKLSQLGVENDELAQEVAEKLGLKLGDSGGVQKLLKALKCNALGLTVGDLPTDAAKREVLATASQLASADMAEYEERPLAPEGSELKRAPKASRTPPGQGTGLTGDPLGYANQGNLDLNDIKERFRRFEKDFLDEAMRGRDSFSRERGKDHIKLFSGKVEAFKSRDGLWTDYDAVKMPTTYTVEVWWDAGGLEIEQDYIMLDVFVVNPKYDANKIGLIYTDGSFRRGVRDSANRAGFPGKEIDYTEQSMQGRDWVSMEAGRLFSRELASRFPDVFRKKLKSAFRESTELVEDKTDKELKRGLEQWIKDVRDARRAGNRRLATQIRRMVMQVVNQKGLDSQRIMNMLDEGYDPGAEYRVSLGEDITPVLRNILARKTAAQVQFDNGKRQTIDMFSASALIAVHDALKKENQEKFRNMMSKNEVEFRRATNFAFKHVG